MSIRVFWDTSLACYVVRNHTSGEVLLSISMPESDHWFQWLDQMPSFAFHSRNEQRLTVRKESRKRGSEYWTAYRKVDGKLRRKYLGLTRDLTLAKLEDVAQTLADQPTRINTPPPQPEHHSLAPLSQHWQEPIIATKMMIPSTRPSIIQRPRLELLVREVFQYPVLMVTAPAGFGKTALMSAWIRQQQADHEQQFIWVSLDEADNSVLRFWIYILNALEKSDPLVSQHALQLLLDHEAPSLDYILTTLINDLAQSEKRFILILDDYQAITESAIHRAVDFLIEHQPPQLHLVFLARTEPPLKVNRLRARGMLYELRADHLRCTKDEARQFLQTFIKMPIPNEVLHRVMERTEGWFAGLQLFALSMKGYNDPVDLLDALAGNEKYIVDYLIEEVLRQQPEDIQYFLLCTSILDPICGDLCDNVVSRTKSQRILEELEINSLFVSSVDKQKQWYRYDALFAESLRYQLSQTHAGMIPLLHRRASLWYADQGQMSEAVEHALKAQDWELTAQLIETSAWTLLSSKGFALWNWLQQIPAAVIQAHPRLCQLNVSLINRVGPLRDALPWLQILEDNSAAYADRQSGDERRHRGRIAAFRALVTSYYGDEEQTRQLCQYATDTLGKDDHFEHAVLATAQATIAESMGYVVEAAQHYLEASQLHNETGNHADTVLNMSMAGVALHLRGRLAHAWDTCQQAIQLVTPENSPPSALACFAYARQANILREWNRLDEAMTMAQESIRLGEQIGYPLALLAGYEVLALILLSRRDTAEAEAALEKLGVLPCIIDNTCLRAWWFTNSEVRLWLQKNELERAVLWAKTLEQSPRLTSRFACEREDVAHVRVYLAMRQARNSLTLLQSLIPAALADQRIDHLIEMYTLSAVAHAMLDEETEALGALRQAVELGKTSGYIRSFVDEGEIVLRLIKKLREGGDIPIQHYLDTLLDAFASERTAEFTPRPLLSEREYEVLLAIAKGASNQEIADQFVLSVETIKRHVSNIFAKLNVNNRTQAVVHAQTLGILFPDVRKP